MRFHVYDDARYASGAVAAGRTLTVYQDKEMSTLLTLYAGPTGSATVPNPYTVPATGIIDFWTNDSQPYGLAQGDTVARPLPIIATGASASTVSVSDFGAKGDGATDDTAAIQAALDAASSGGCTVLFPPGRYLTGQLSVGGNDLTISGYGATLVSNLGVNTAMPGFFGYALLENINVAEQKLSGAVPNVNIAAGDLSLDMTGTPLDAVKEGDIVIIGTTKNVPGSSVYRAGSYRRVVSVDGSTINLDAEIETSLDIAADGVEVDVTASYRNLLIEGLCIELVESGGQAGMLLKNLNGCVVRDVTVVGGGTVQAVGISLEGFDLRVENCRLEGPFWDDGQHLGYGIGLAGHNTIVRGCSARQCRHGVAHGSDAFISSHMTVADSYFDDAEMDVHGSCQYVSIIGNRVTQVARRKSYAAAGMQIRGRHVQIVGNTVEGAASPVCDDFGIRFMEVCDEDIVISGNTVLGVTYGLQWNNLTVAAVNGISISGNRIDAHWGIYSANEMLGASITGNSITGNTGASLRGGNDVVLSGNRIGFGADGYGIGILLDAETTTTWKRWMVAGNILYGLTSDGAYGIRIKNAYDDITITANIFDQSQAGDAAIYIAEDTSLTRFVRFNNLGDNVHTQGAAAPASGEWSQGDICWNSDADSTESVGWVCTVSGTPGTWKSFGTVVS